MRYMKQDIENDLYNYLKKTGSYEDIVDAAETLFGDEPCLSDFGCKIINMTENRETFRGDLELSEEQKEELLYLLASCQYLLEIMARIKGISADKLAAKFLEIRGKDPNISSKIKSEESEKE